MINIQGIVDVVIFVYGVVIVACLITQGLMAVYYFTRRTHLRHYLQDTPPWIIQTQQALKK